MKAAIVYWYSGSAMRMDGGGLRVRAWESALQSAGYETDILPLWAIGGGIRRGSWLSSLKRSLLPMPFERALPAEALKADLVVATVPAVFDDALGKVPPAKLVLDWMDLWSTAARNMGDDHWLSRPGGRIQARRWHAREATWAERSTRNVFAGYSDLVEMGLGAEFGSRWIPTPVACDESVEPLPGSAGARRLGFIANLDYPPNERSLRLFLKRFHSRLDAHGIELWIAGFGSEKVGGWGYGVKLLGPVDDVRDFYASIDAAVVPIEHGSGIKVKAVEALSYGLPVFGTTHVRAGFSPEFRPAIAPIERIFDAVWPENLGQQRFAARFSQAAFTADVKALLRSEPM